MELKSGKYIYWKNSRHVVNYISSLQGPPGFSAGRGAPVGDDPDDGLLQHARPHVGQVRLQLGGDEGEANLEVRVPLEAGSAEAHPAIEAGPAVAEEVAKPDDNLVSM